MEALWRDTWLFSSFRDTLHKQALPSPLPSLSFSLFLSLFEDDGGNCLGHTSHPENTSHVRALLGLT